MKRNRSSINISVPTTGLGLLFIGLKLGGVINWPWVWVTSPLWIPPAVGIITLGTIFTVNLVKEIMNDRKRKKRIQERNNELGKMKTKSKKKNGKKEQEQEYTINNDLINYHAAYREQIAKEKEVREKSREVIANHTNEILAKNLEQERFAEQMIQDMEKTPENEVKQKVFKKNIK